MADRLHLRRWLGMALLAFSTLVGAAEAEPVVADRALEARVMALAVELRCLVCQNQTIADSHADLAVDLRKQIRSQLSAGRSEDQIRQYMTDRYGDFVLYKPPFKTSTALLWVGPPLLLVAALGALFMLLRRRLRAPADAFDPPDDGDDAADAHAPDAGPEPARR